MNMNTRTRRSDVPKEYRRPLWDIALHWGVGIFFALAMINFVLFCINVLNH